MIGGQTLAGKQIVIAVTGSIAAVEVVKLIHSLRRCGAVVQPIMSHAATGIIQPDALTYFFFFKKIQWKRDYHPVVRLGRAYNLLRRGGECRSFTDCSLHSKHNQ